MYDTVQFINRTHIKYVPNGKIVIYFQKGKKHIIRLPSGDFSARLPLMTKKIQGYKYDKPTKTSLLTQQATTLTQEIYGSNRPDDNWISICVMLSAVNNFRCKQRYDQFANRTTFRITIFIYEHVHTGFRKFSF